MVRSSSYNQILEEKKKRFMAIAIRICKKRGLPIPKINFEGCPYQIDNYEGAHYHPDEHKICCSETQLSKKTFEDIDRTVAHELSHIRVGGHGPDFDNENEKSQISGFDPHAFPGVTVINGGSSKDRTPYKPIKPSKTHCNYHLCKKKAKLQKCSYCKGYYCEEHIMPKLPGHYNVDGSNSPFFITNPEWGDTYGHPCPGYVGVEDKEKKEQTKKYLDTLDILSGKKKVYTFEPIKEETKILERVSTAKTEGKGKEDNEKEIKIPKQIDVHEVLSEFFNVELNEFISKFDKIKIVDIKPTGGLYEILGIEQHPFKVIVDILKEFRERLFEVSSPLRHKMDIDLFFDCFKPFIHFYVKLLVRRNMFNNPKINKEFDDYFLKPCAILFNRLNKRFDTNRFTDEIKNHFNSIPNLTVKIIGKDDSLIKDKTIYVLEYNRPEFKEYSKRRLYAVLNTDEKGMAFFKLPYGIYEVYAEGFKEKVEIIQKDGRDKEANFKTSYFVGTSWVKKLPPMEPKPPKKIPAKAIVMGIIVIIILSLLLKNYLIPPKPIDCKDGTLHDSCSTKRPYYCSNGKLTENLDLCGCADGERIFENKCISIVECIDGTLHPECSMDKPYQCKNGTLILNALLCGCPEGKEAVGNVCK